MASTDERLKQFYTVFGNQGGDLFPGNVGVSRTALAVCNEIMSVPDPLLYDYFIDWDKHNNDTCRPYSVELRLLAVGQWEGAWALAQLHYDQILKQEAKTKTCLHKGHPLCNLAIVARGIGSPALTRHYSMLSSAGDIYWEHELPDLKYGGYGRTMLEQFESHHQHAAWGMNIRNKLSSVSIDKPLYLESFLASRWFSETYANHFVNLEVAGCDGQPFAEALLDALESANGASSTTTGARFEAAAGLLVSSTPGFEVDSARKTTDEQVDLVAVYTAERLTHLGLQPCSGLVECKSSSGKVNVSELRDFGAKCLFHRVGFGILMARAGITGGKVNPDDLFKEPHNVELTRRRFQVDGLTILVLDISRLRGKSRELRGLLDDLRNDYRRLVFGPVP